MMKKKTKENAEIKMMMKERRENMEMKMMKKERKKNTKMKMIMKKIMTRRMKTLSVFTYFSNMYTLAMNLITSLYSLQMALM